MGGLWPQNLRVPRFQIVGQPATMLVALGASTPVIRATHWWDVHTGCGMLSMSAAGRGQAPSRKGLPFR
jgi:hypothetical protein